MTRTKLMAIGIIIVVIVAVGSYSLYSFMLAPEQPKEGGTLTIADPSPIVMSLDPRTAGPSTFPYVAICFDQAFEPGLKDEELIPSLCTSWERVDDLTLVLNIRQGVMFHNGEEMTSEDWKFTLEEFGKPPPPPPAPPPPVQYEYCQHISEIEIVDRYTIRITTDQPYGAIPDIFTLHSGNLWILPKSAVEAAGEDFTWNPVGSGPFKFAERVAGQYVKYERFEDYWGGRPNLESIIVRQIPDPDTLVNALETGEIDVLTRVPEMAVGSLLENPDIQVWTDVVTPLGDFTAFNHRFYPTNDLRFRQAIHMIINYDEILPIINPNGRIERKFGFLYTFKASGAAPWAYNPAIEAEFPEYDLEEAKRLIAEMQAEQPIPTLKVWGWERTVPWVTYLATQMEQELGLDVDFQIQTGPEAIDTLLTKANEWHLYTMGAAAAGHPSVVMPYVYHSTRGVMPPTGPLPNGSPPPDAPPPDGPPPDGAPAGGENYAGYVNTQVDEWIDLADMQMSRAEMANFFYLAERQAVRDLAYIWPYEVNAAVAVRSDLVGDVEPYPYGTMIFLVNSDHNVYKK